ncbi:14580_t:CDS:1, partial [Dentiscutata erythropus]
MVDANTYLNSNYPFPAVNRTLISSLDVSNKNLINTINLGPSENFTNLASLNASLNQISGFTLGELPKLQKIDFSHNIFTSFGIKNDGLLPSLAIVNFSHNFLTDVGPGSVILLRLDVSSNALTKLDLSACKNLLTLNCSGNPDLSNLTLNSAFDPIDANAFDCRGTSIGKINTTSFIYDCQTGTRIKLHDTSATTSPAVVTVTNANQQIQSNNNN